MDQDLHFDVDELAMLFGEPLPLSRPELLDYWFRYHRTDGISVTLSLSGYERSVAVIVRCSDQVAASSIRIDHCQYVRVLEADRKTLEIVSPEQRMRCFIALAGDSIVDVSPTR